MRGANLIFGLLFLLAFVVSGWYMKSTLTPANLNNLTVRMEFRSNHIYLLFISLLNLLAFKVILSKSHLYAFFNILFRTLLISSGFIAIWAFMYEHTGELTERRMTFYVALLPIISIGVIALNELITFINKNN